MADVVTLEREDGIGIVTLSRPECLNAMSFELVDALHATFDELQHDLSTRVVVLTGAGRGFCAGLDLREDLAAWPEALGHPQTKYRMQQRFASLPLRLREIPQPVIAAVHGPASGGGLSLAAACDMRIADPTARFNVAFVKIGLSAGDLGASWLLPRLVGPSAAAELLYTGRPVLADEALRLGLVSRVTEPGQDVAEAMELAQAILANSPLGIRMTKELFGLSLGGLSFREMIEVENRTQALCALTDDFVEGVRSFAEKRSPRYADR